MKEVKISIRMEGDELPLISAIKKIAMEKFGVKEDQIIHRIKIIEGGKR